MTDTAGWTMATVRRASDAEAGRPRGAAGK